MIEMLFAAAVFENVFEQSINNANTVFRLLLALIAGALVGLERESHAKPAGFRTHIIISIGACLLMLLSIYIPQTFMDFKNGDPGRIAAGVVTGIGFLGAGAIMRFGLTVKGMTSAASIWAIAAVGMTIGAGFYAAAAVAMVIMLVVLHLLEIFEDKYLGWTLYKRMTVMGARREGMFENLQRVFKENKVSIYDWSMIEKIEGGTVEYSTLTRIRESIDVRKLFEDLRAIEGVMEIRLE